MHTHSTASDGTCTPTDLVRAAAVAGLDVVAITDHDTTAGWGEAVAALPAGCTLVRGIELSCRAGGISVHLLGYLFDPADEAFRAQRSQLREQRRVRARKIVQRLTGGGIPISWERVSALASGGVVGRPHIARALVEIGRARDIQDAFGTLLHPSGPYYVAKADLEVEPAIATIRAAGGVAVLAHPLARTRGRVVDTVAIEAMAAAGLAGIEVDHPNHTPADRQWLRELAGRLGLIGTGSSDFHGANKDIALGAETSTTEAYEAIVAAAGPAIRPVTG
ncbi:MAG TPA: PHP domain-containing protein [Mycobacteriales bacterium]|nr:PHP domain-containing protein [Mycobacteriales bacterium]